MKGRKGKRKAPAPETLPDDLLDDVDKFHKQRGDDSDSLERAPDADDDSDDVEGVMDLNDESEPDSDADLDAGGDLATIITAERAIKRKLALARAADGAEDDASDGGGDVPERDGDWGASRKDYYDDEGVDVDFDSDDEAAAEEEAEALRLQQEHAKKLQRANFGLAEEASDASDADASDDDDDGTLGAHAAALGGVHTERAAKRASAATAEARRAAVLRDAPELQSLLEDLTASFDEVRARTAPLLAELQAGGLATAEGLSYLETKHMLLLTYCVHSLFYVLLKLEGRPVKEHPVVTRLLEAKTFLEKLRPIDKRLRPQLERLLRAQALAAQGGGAPAAEDDAMAHRPRPDALVATVEDQDPETAVYRPPKIAPLAMEEPAPRGRAAQAARRERAAARDARGNQFVRDLEAELGGAPQELRETGGGVGDALATLRQRHKLEARARVEEDMMMRVPMSKDERKALRARQRAGLSAAAALDDFADDVAGVLDVGDGEKAYFDKVRLGQKFGGDLSGGRAAAASGDAELPGKASLADRRAKYDALKARQAAQLAALEDASAAQRPPPELDEAYLAAQARSEAKKASKAAKKHRAPLHPPVADPQATAARSVTTEILKNRGLTPHRRKDQKNPRKRQREKHADAEKRRKGQVVPVRKQAGPYGGEATGIKAGVAKSVRLS